MIKYKATDVKVFVDGKEIKPTAFEYPFPTFDTIDEFRNHYLLKPGVGLHTQQAIDNNSGEINTSDFARKVSGILLSINKYCRMHEYLKWKNQKTESNYPFETFHSAAALRKFFNTSGTTMSWNQDWVDNNLNGDFSVSRYGVVKLNNRLCCRMSDYLDYKKKKSEVDTSTLCSPETAQAIKEKFKKKCEGGYSIPKTIQEKIEEVQKAVAKSQALPWLSEIGTYSPEKLEEVKVDYVALEKRWSKCPGKTLWSNTTNKAIKEVVEISPEALKKANEAFKEKFKKNRFKEYSPEKLEEVKMDFNELEKRAIAYQNEVNGGTHLSRWSGRPDNRTREHKCMASLKNASSHVCTTLEDLKKAMGKFVDENVDSTQWPYNLADLKFEYGGAPLDGIRVNGQKLNEFEKPDPKADYRERPLDNCKCAVEPLIEQPKKLLTFKGPTKEHKPLPASCFSEPVENGQYLRYEGPKNA